MYLNRWVLLISCAGGFVGALLLAGAFSDYRAAVRAYSEVNVTHAPDSAIWSDSGTRLTLDLVIDNHSPSTVTIEHLELRLYASGVFAGADYAAWEPVTVPRESQVTVPIAVDVSNADVAGRMEGADMSLRGETRLRFTGVERPLTQRISVRDLPPPSE
jgi:hypothetical protein